MKHLVIGPLLAAVLLLGYWQAKARTWRDKTGRYKIDAEFVELTPEVVVKLRKANGEIIAVALDRLSPKDQAFAKAAAEKPKAVKAPAKKPRYAIRDELFKPLASHPGYEIVSFAAEEFGTKNSNVRCAMAMPDGSFWVGGKNQILRFGGQSWKRIQPPGFSPAKSYLQSSLTPYLMRLDREQTL